MSIWEIVKFLFLTLVLMSATSATLIIFFNSVLDTLAAHSSQINRLDPRLLTTTIVGIFGFAGISVAARVVIRRRAQGPHPGPREPPTEPEVELDE